MSLRVLLSATACAAVFAVATPAVAQSSQTQGQTVTATGTGQVRVHPKNRHSNSSIVAAVDASRHAAINRALAEAHEYALDYATAAGLTLGSVFSVSDQQALGFYGPGAPGFSGPFGPDRYCGTIQQFSGRAVPGGRPKSKKVHRCFVPQFAYSTLTVTYSAS